MKGEGKEKKKKKAMVAPLVPFGDNVIKNPASTYKSPIHTIVTVQLVNFCTLHKSSCRNS